MKWKSASLLPARCGSLPSAIAGTTLAIGGAMFTPLVAQAQESGEYDWKFFFGGSYISPLSDSSISGIGDSVETSNEFGYELGIEWKPSDRFGFELAYLDAEQEIEADSVTIGDISMRPWLFSLNFHVIDGNAFNWYIGPTLSYVDWSDIQLPGGGSLEIDSDTGYGLSTGFVIGLGQTLGIQFGLRYLQASAESDTVLGEVDVDPLFTSFSGVFRF